MHAGGKKKKEVIKKRKHLTIQPLGMLVIVIGLFEICRRWADLSAYDIKVLEIGEHSTPYAFESASQYFDVICQSVCAAPVHLKQA